MAHRTLEHRLRAALDTRYQIERELGRGGMATVFLARDLKHKRSVALKVMEPELAASLGGERFLREIELAAGLAHPHILPVFDSGDADGLLWYAMPYVEGESLRDQLAREPRLPLEVARRIALEVADALEHAHRRGVVHRDIKPENILLQDSHALVADFGIARAVSKAGGESLTRAGLALGTPAYISPEVAAGDAEADGRSDVYSLGCVLYEMLAGQTPFSGPTAQAVIAKRLSGPPPRIRLARPDVPEPMERTIIKALAPAPADRFQSAQDLSAALRDDRALRARRPRLGAVVAAGIGLGLLALGYAIVGRNWLTAPPATPVSTPTSSIRSVAVLPFANTSGEPENEHFSEGLTDELIGALSRLERLKVAGRTSVFALKGKGLPLSAIAESLGVTTVLEGSVRRGGGRLKVTAQLVEARNDSVLWSDSYDREMRDVFAVQEDIAQAIARALHVQLSGAEGPRLLTTGTKDLEAYDLYLRGRYHWARVTQAEMELAVQAFQQAVQRDSGFAAAWAGLADAEARSWNLGRNPDPEGLSRARAAAQRALKLDPNLGDAYASQGYISISLREFRAAEASFRKAIRLKPSYPWAHHYYSMLLNILGRVEEALEENRRVLEIDPLSLAGNANRGTILCVAGDYQAAHRHLGRALELEPDFPLALYYLGALAVKEHRYEDAAFALARVRERAPGFPGVTGALAVAYAALGRPAAADSLIQGLGKAGGGYRSRLNLGFAYAMRGETGTALRQLAQAEWSLASLVNLRSDPLLAPLRADPGYAGLVHRLGIDGALP